MQSLADPDDKLLASLRAQGVIMPQQYCNGTALPTGMLDTPIDTHIAPLYLSSTPEDFVRLLPEAANLSASQDEADVSVCNIRFLDSNFTIIAQKLSSQVL
jgi:hypothetical protein